MDMANLRLKNNEFKIVALVFEEDVKTLCLNRLRENLMPALERVNEVRLHAQCQGKNREKPTAKDGLSCISAMPYELMASM